MHGHHYCKRLITAQWKLYRLFYIYFMEIISGFCLICYCSLFFTLSNAEIPIVIVLSFDGFRYDYLEKAPTPYFKQIAEAGVRAKWMNNVYVTKTFPNHFSIATGLYEEVHGIIGNEMYDPVLNETFTLSNTDPKWWDNGFTIPIWVANQNADAKRHSGSVMWSGANVKIHNKTADYVLPYNSNITWNQRVDTALQWITKEKDPANLVMMYIEEPDATGHQFGPDSDQVRQKIIEADHLVGYLLTQLKSKSLINNVNLIILSDHGMVSVTENRVINMDNVLNQTLYTKYGHSPVWNILPQPGHESDVYKKLLEGSKTFRYTVYQKSEIPDQFHYKNNRRVLKFVIEAAEGYDFAYNGTVASQKIWGEHGYDPNLPSMHPIFLAMGPAFKKNYSAEPFLNLDVFPLLCDILKIVAPSNNGSLERIQQILKPNSVLETVFTGSWIVACATLMCILLAIGLTGAAMSLACSKPSPTVAFVMLRNPQFVGGEKELSSREEKQQLLDDTD